MTNFERYTAALDDIKLAKEWNNLPDGPKYTGSTMHILVAHSKIKLKRAGQQSEGGQNYWTCPDSLANAALQYLVDNWDTIYPQLLSSLEDKAATAAMECQAELNEMQAVIDTAKGKCFILNPYPEESILNEDNENQN